MRNSVLEKAAVRKVKYEIDTIIDNARSQLQSYIEDESDVASLKDVTKSFTLIERTLQLIQFNGAAVLAREMGDVVDGLIDESIKQKDKAQETLSRGILQMSDYLEYVQMGRRDVPIVLLPLLNDLRGVREAPLLSEHILFFPNLDDIEVPNVNATFGMPAQEYAKKLRYGFQFGLVGLIQNKDIDVAATKICKVAIRLHQCSKELASQRLWWISSAVAQALAIGTLHTSAGLASLLGQVDRQIKNFVKYDEVEFANNIPTGLIKNLLYYVGIAQERGRIVNKVKDAYGLNDLIPNELAIDQMREGIAGPNLDVLQAVSKALHEDIATVKDSIELYVHSENRSPESVNKVGQELQKIADTLSMLGLEEPRIEVMREVTALKGLSADELEHADDSFVKVAETLIKVESIVENFVNYRFSDKPFIQSADEVDDANLDLRIENNQLKNIQVQTIAEALTELEEAKNSISQVLSSPEDEVKLEETQDRFRKIIGALSILQLDDVAAILENVQAYLIGSQAAEELSSQPEKLDALADTVTSVECYLEAIIANEDNPKDILRYGIESVSRLVGAEAVNSDLGDSLQTIAVNELLDDESLNLAEDSQIGKKNTEISEDNGLEDLSATSLGLSIDPELFDEITAEENKAEVETETEAEAEAKIKPDVLNNEEFSMDKFSSVEVDSTEEVNAETLSEDEGDELSPEFAELQETSIKDAETELNSFISEAESKDLTLDLNADDETFGVVEVDLEATSSLKLDEIEYELSANNQAIDPNNAEEQAAIDLPSLTGFEDDVDKSEAADEAQPLPPELLEEESFPYRELDSSSYVIVIKEDGADKELQALKQSADNEIIEIFIEEAEEEIEKISRNLPAWCANSQDEEALITTRRSFHTLKGSGRLIGAEIIGEFSWQFESLLNKVIDNTLDVTADLYGILKQSIAALQQLLIQLKSGQTPSIDIQALIASVQHFYTQRNSIIENDNAKIDSDESINSITTEEVFRANALEDDSSAVAIKVEDNIVVQNDATEASESFDSNDNFDAELNKIFIEEAVQHISMLEASIGENKHAKKLIVDENVLHTLHTLLGSSRTAGVDAIAKICAPLEKFCQECNKQSQGVVGENLDIVSNCIELFKKVITEYGDNLKLSIVDVELLKQVNDLDCIEIPVLQEIVATPEEHQELENMETQHVSLTEANTSTEVITDGLDLYEEKDADLVEVFLEEASDILTTCGKCLEKWQANSTDENSVLELRRQLHTLKGSARMAAYANLGDFSHALESVVIPVAKGEIAATDGMFSLFQRCLDSLYGMIDDAVAQRPVYPATNLIAELNEARVGDGPLEVAETISDQTFAASAKNKHIEKNQNEEKTVVKIPVLRSVVNQDKPQATPPVIAPQQAIRLQAGMLDNLVNNAGEVNIFQARLEQVSSEYTTSIKEFEQIVDRLRDQLRNLEIETEAQILSRHANESPDREDFDPLELDRYSNIHQLSRSLAESVNDLLSVKDILFEQVRDSEMLLQQQHRISSDLQEGLMRTRMVQFNQLVPRMQRIVRQTARELGKDADLKVIGADTEVDSSILNRIVAPLEHLIRNAISHGIEDKSRREASGKPSIGVILITVSREGAEIVIDVADDGAGINPDKVKKKALELGLIENADINERDLLNLILTPGFSTVGKVTQVSGRGVGMDVVANELKQLGGFLKISSVFGEGAKFTVRIPFTLAIVQVLLIKCGDEFYAAPLASVEGIVRLSTHELKEKYVKNNSTYHYAEQEYRLCHLGTLLGVGHPQLDGANNMLPILLVRSGDTRLAIHVEATLGSREIVVKPLASQLSRLPAVSGATILGDGSVVLILDIQGLMRMDAIEQLEHIDQSNGNTSENKIPTVLVVDDSITIRKVTTRFLERNNYKVATAKDGIDAIQVLQDFTPDMILLDIEMPRMDGYELATYVRSTKRLKDVPIIMITSRTGEKHRQRAFDIGVQQYLGKPYNETELLSNIETVLHQNVIS